LFTTVRITRRDLRESFRRWPDKRRVVAPPRSLVSIVLALPLLILSTPHIQAADAVNLGVKYVICGSGLSYQFFFFGTRHLRPQVHLQLTNPEFRSGSDCIGLKEAKEATVMIS
jgi:hypothetical protein